MGRLSRDINERLREVDQEGTELKTSKYLLQNQWIAIILFTLAIIMATIWFSVIHKGVCVVLNTSDLTFSEWFIFALIFTVIVWIVSYFIIRVPMTAMFGY